MRGPQNLKKKTLSTLALSDDETGMVFFFLTFSRHYLHFCDLWIVWSVNNQPVHQLDLVEKPHYYFMFSPRRSWMISSAGNWHLVHSLRVAYRAYARTVLPPPSLARQHGVSILNLKFTVYKFTQYRIVGVKEMTQIW